MDTVIHLGDELKKDFEKLDRRLILMTKLLSLTIGAIASSLTEDKAQLIIEATKTMLEESSEG